MQRRRGEQDMGDVSSEEAKEEIQHPEDQQEEVLEEEEEMGEDLMENEEDDYKPIAQLDQYQDQGVDDEEISYNYDAINKANFQIQKRKKLNRGNVGNMDEIDDLMYESEDIERGLRRRQISQYNEQEEEQVDQRRYLDAQQCKGKLPQWIKETDTIKYIHAKLTKFLTKFKTPQKDYAIYALAIRDMVINNRQSFEIKFEHIKEVSSTIALWVGLYPSLILPEMNLVAYKIAVRNFPAFKSMKSEIFAKIVDLPFVDPIRDLRYTHLGKLVQIRGVITIRSQVLNQMKRISYRCVRCGEIKGPYVINDKTDIKFTQCSSCQSNGPFLIDKQKTIFRNYQKMTVQESPSEVLPGRIPRNKQVLLYGDNVDTARPGDEVEIVGIFDNKYDCGLNVKQGFPLFSTMIQAIHICKAGDSERRQFDEYKADEIKKMSKDPNLAKKIYGSIAPSIFGHQSVKRGLTLAMFGGQAIQGTHRVRGDINVLLLGDPGIAKSQFLKSIQKVFHRSIYTTGKGASAVGLTASVKKDFSTNQWKLEAGALVLADKGICLIDQFDKMNQHDRTSIHEAMQQQSISISKAGIVTSLRARCSVIAAANPNQGRYNSKLSFSDNVDLSQPILSRFDIMNVIKDQVHQETDKNLSIFVINSHIENHPYVQKYNVQNLQYLQSNKEQQLPYIQLSLLKQYIRYARQKCHPHLSAKNHDIIRNFFNELREASKRYGGMQVSIRQVESIIRIATAHAKMHLRSEIQKRDVDVGIQVMLESFIQTQKTATAKNIKKQFKKYLLMEY